MTDKGAYLRGDAAVHALLNSIDGIVYVVGVDGTILDVGDRSWTQFADRNGVEGLSVGSVIGRSLFAMMNGDDLILTQRLLHERICQGGRDEIAYDFRCDAPDAERNMRMSISAILDYGTVAGVLYQSQILSEIVRIPMPLFSTEYSRTKHSGYRDDQIVTICSYCQDVAWPIGAGHDGDRTWISAYDYYRGGGPIDIVVSHGVCPPCYRRVIAS